MYDGLKGHWRISNEIIPVKNGTNNEVLIEHLFKFSTDGLVADMLMQPLGTNRQQSDVRMS